VHFCGKCSRYRKLKSKKVRQLLLEDLTQDPTEQLPPQDSVQARHEKINDANPEDTTVKSNNLDPTESSKKGEEYFDDGSFQEDLF